MARAAVRTDDDGVSQDQDVREARQAERVRVATEVWRLLGAGEMPGTVVSHAAAYQDVGAALASVRLPADAGA